MWGNVREDSSTVMYHTDQRICYDLLISRIDLTLSLCTQRKAECGQPILLVICVSFMSIMLTTVLGIEIILLNCKANSGEEDQRSL